MKKALLMLVAAIGLTVQANTDGFIMFSIFSPGQLPVPTTKIDGVRLSLIYGDCLALNGFDLSLAGMVRERANGFQLGGYNACGTDAAGFQLGVYNAVESDFFGCQMGIVNRADRLSGCQIGFVNFKNKLSGWQIGFVNVVTDPVVQRRWFPFVRADW